MKYDKDEAARLVAELREDDTQMTPAPWRWVHVEGTDTEVTLLGSDVTQEHARIIDTDTAYYGPDIPDRIGIARLRNNARPLADQLEAAMAEVAALQAKLDQPILEVIRQRDAARSGIAAVFQMIQHGDLDVWHDVECPEDDTCTCIVRRQMLEIQIAGGDENARILIAKLPVAMPRITHDDNCDKQTSDQHPCNCEERRR